MSVDPLPTNEAERALAAIAIDRDVGPDAQFDDLVSLAAAICRTPMAVISFITSDEQRIKARVGHDFKCTPRDVAFCAHTVAHADRGLFIVPDALADERFRQHPAVVGEPYVRFYAGAPIIDDGGRAVGSICVIDRVPRELTPRQQTMLQGMARNVLLHLQARYDELALRIDRKMT